MAKLQEEVRVKLELDDIHDLLQRIERLEARVAELEDQPSLCEAIKQDRRDLGYWE